MNGLKTFSEIFWPRKEKKNYNPLYKDFVHVFEGIYIYIYIYEKKNRDKKNKEELAYVTRL